VVLILKWILKKWGGRVWARLILCRTEVIDRLL
jgi:hypothetical protein